MRNVYLLLNIVFLATAAGLAALNLRWHPTRVDPATKWTPPAEEVTDTPAEQAVTTPQLAMIRDQNLFSPHRGAQVSETSSRSDEKKRAPRFELVGICSIGENAGAIIETKNGPGAGSGNGKRSYFTVGSEVDNGFVLESVGERSVVLRRNQETLELKISRTRFASEIKKGGAKVAAPRNVNQPPLRKGSRPGPPVAQPGVNPARTQNRR